MEENIIEKIAEAEREAAARKAQAQLDAAQIVAQAEKRASEIAKDSEAALKQLREQTLKQAEERAHAEYDAALQKSGTDAKAYADSVLSRADDAALEIVGRLTK